MKTNPAAFILAAVVATAGTAFAADKERTGEEIVKQQCSKCHATGEHGAPRIDDRAAWVPRLKNGLDATVKSAARGHGEMPVRGGMVDLSDSELRSAIVYMFNTVGTPKPPPPAAQSPYQKFADGLEIYLGVKPVKEGLAYLNITVRDEKTHLPVGGAQVDVAVTNPVMGTESKALVGAGDGSYGADVRVSGRETHAITVNIKRAGQAHSTQVKFDYKG